MRKLLVAAMVGSLLACGGGSSKPCKDGPDPGGMACTSNSECAVTCVCERSGSRFRVHSDGLCRQDMTCQSATADCLEACLLVAASWTGNFCNR